MMVCVIRPLSYANSDVFLVAFSIVDRSSFDAITATVINITSYVIFLISPP